ncbi:carboxylesterase family protein [Trinickia sp. NRRL B-1857]|uniref:carboxylesterase/lipase family protein n=1 Tax=Trinickia sp. NRRL B-1857 TaxID=3162879 RepID=UPI003D28514A
MQTSSNHSAKCHLVTAIATATALLCSTGASAVPANAARAALAPQIKLTDGIVEGLQMRGQKKDVRVFRGIPYAAPPVGEYRFREPQPVARWAGVRQARQFGPRCMQPVPADKSNARAKEMNEDCLYLNVWAPTQAADKKLPVLVYFHGGGFTAGDGSDPRYDGANLAARGIVMVTVNYRLGVFGFLAPPEAARESSHGTAGNYGLLDQVSALRWVRDNIAQFGGDPSKVTIAGSSAGSMSVSAHMASPLSRGLFAGAIGESGGAFAPTAFWTRQEAEHAGTRFAARVGAASLQQLRSLPAHALLTAAGQSGLTKESIAFWPSIDGHFLTESPEQVFTNGGQAQVPLMLGSNSQEQPYTAILGDAEPTPENWRQTVKAKFPAHAEEVLAHYPGNDENEVKHAATALASDLFIGHGVWRWMERHRETGRSPVFYYRYTQPLPPEVQRAGQPQDTDPRLGAKHSAQVPYALGNLDHVRRYAWTAADYDVSRMFSSYVEQFVKTGNPSGTTPIGQGASVEGATARSESWLPRWPALVAENRGMLMQTIGEQTSSVWDRSAPRHGLLQRLTAGGQSAAVTAPASAQVDLETPAEPPAE